MVHLLLLPPAHVRWLSPLVLCYISSTLRTPSTAHVDIRPESLEIRERTLLSLFDSYVHLVPRSFIDGLDVVNN